MTVFWRGSSDLRKVVYNLWLLKPKCSVSFPRSRIWTIASVVGSLNSGVWRRFKVVAWLRARWDSDQLLMNNKKVSCSGRLTRTRRFQTELAGSCDRGLASLYLAVSMEQAPLLSARSKTGDFCGSRSGLRKFLALRFVSYGFWTR